MKNIKLNKFSVVDIETMCHKGKQIPVLISHYDPVNGSQLFEINHNYIKNSEYEKGVKVLFSGYFIYLRKCHISLIFAHNLGGFDGYFLFKYIYLASGWEPRDLEVMIDDSNRFIQITQKMVYTMVTIATTKITFKDSFRLLGGVSLNTLCKIYGVEQKLCEYNQLWNSFNLFDHSNRDSYIEWKDYAAQDSKCLYEAICKAQEVYKERFNVDVTNSVSASQLAFKLFKKTFSPIKLPNRLRKDDEKETNNFNSFPHLKTRLRVNIINKE